MTWEEQEKIADIRVELMSGPDWAVCFMVLSAVSRLHQLSYVGAVVANYNSVQGVIHLQNQWAHRQQVAVCRFPEMFLRQQTAQKKKQSGTGK